MALVLLLSTVYLPRMVWEQLESTEAATCICIVDLRHFENLLNDWWHNGIMKSEYNGKTEIRYTNTI